MNFLFTGTVRQCVDHYSKCHLAGKWSRKSGAAFWTIAEFIGVKQDTVSGWFYWKKGLDGYRTICLAFFFQEFGYDVVELARLKQYYPASYLLTELLGYGLITPDQARERLGLATNNVMYLLAGGRNTSEKRIKIIQQLHADLATDLKMAKRRLAVLVADFRKGSVKLPKNFKLRSLSAPIPVKTLTDQIEAMLRFVEECTQNRSELCGLMSDDLHRLSEAAEKLCGVLEGKKTFDSQVA